ncbi:MULTISPECIES: hypothetical protein [Acinetobacter calcoaceticus/baumannii complex]|uniref:hypothetical protein n=1 Tax=Acinetobacter calcoaceticus/baumannii complex TaxID=909768 RepID=UPI0004F56E06|nr:MULTISPECIES: hypothetical protein [Acinetobacter calcoaceticus/baumannii complex]MDI9733876.1 hypothetical protein [Acinetobacter baumannii]HDX6140356.1 hypothetical protein [Acinetobacter baumannii]
MLLKRIYQVLSIINDITSLIAISFQLLATFGITPQTLDYTSLLMVLLQLLVMYPDILQLKPLTTAHVVIPWQEFLRAW